MRLTPYAVGYAAKNPATSSWQDYIMIPVQHNNHHFPREILMLEFVNV
jgi:hypothetical protein